MDRQNKASLGAHARNCKSNPKNNESNVVEALNTVELTIVEVLPDASSSITRPSKKLNK